MNLFYFRACNSKLFIKAISFLKLYKTHSRIKIIIIEQVNSCETKLHKHNMTNMYTKHIHVSST